VKVLRPTHPRNRLILDADAVVMAEGNMGRCAIASTRPIRRGRRPWHAWKLFAREPGDLRVDPVLLYRGRGPQREGEEP